MINEGEVEAKHLGGPGAQAVYRPRMVPDKRRKLAKVAKLMLMKQNQDRDD